MNQISIKITIVIFFLLVACTATNKHLYRQREQKHYPFNNDLVLIAESRTFKLEDDTLSVRAYYVNHSDKDILVPLKYIRPIFYFSNEDIKLSHIVNINQGYPNLEFEKLNNKKRKAIIQNACEPYIDIEGYYKLLKGDTLHQTYDLKKLNYIGFKQGQEYKAVMIVYVSDKVKEYCPMIWSGRIKSDTISIDTE